MMQEIFNQVEELVGTYPTGENLKNAVHAIITKSMMHEMEHMDDGFLGGSQRKTYLRQVWRNVEALHIMKNVDYIARNYEHARGTTQYLNGLFSRER